MFNFYYIFFNDAVKQPNTLGQSTSVNEGFIIQ